MSITLTFSGDFCPIGIAERQLKSSNNISQFGDILSCLTNSDLSITNLECPLTMSNKRIHKFGPNLKVHPGSVDLLIEGNIKLVTLANNHILDYSSEGLLDTIEVLKANSISFLGAGTDLIKASEPYVTEINSKRIAFFNFTQSEYSIAAKESSGANPINPLKNTQEIVQIKKSADYIIVVVHGGHELEPLPSPYFRDLLRFYASLGVTAVIGHHTHVCSGYEIFNGVPIFYGLGNFIFPYKTDVPDSWYMGCLLQLDLDNENVKFKLIPFTQDRKDYHIKKLEDEAAKQFTQEINKLNEVIANDINFNNIWESKFKSIRLKLITELMISNRWLRALVKRKVIPLRYIVSDKDIMKYYHILFCEGHREQTQFVLKEEILKQRGL